MLLGAFFTAGCWSTGYLVWRGVSLKSGVVILVGYGVSCGSLSALSQGFPIISVLHRMRDFILLHRRSEASALRRCEVSVRTADFPVMKAGFSSGETTIQTASHSTGRLCEIRYTAHTKLHTSNMAGLGPTLATS